MRDEKLKAWIGEFLDSKRDQLEDNFDRLSARDQWGVARELMTYVTPRKSERVLIHGDLATEKDSNDTLIVMDSVLIEFEQESGDIGKCCFTMPSFVSCLQNRGVYAPQNQIKAHLIKNGYYYGGSRRLKVAYNKAQAILELTKGSNERVWQKR